MRLDSVMRDDIADRTRKTVEIAHGVVAHYHAQEQAGVLTRAQAQAAAKETLRNVRYGGSDYFWINDMHPRMIMHPTNTRPRGDRHQRQHRRGRRAHVRRNGRGGAQGR
ncbi:MAG: cache domain-containing protein [Brevundimonas sp.]|nr:cache domain-containing protein [Brevundimonas sp.]